MAAKLNSENLYDRSLRTLSHRMEGTINMH